MSNAPEATDLRPTRWRVRVPGSTSNLGPGFDQLGLALGLFLEVTLEDFGPAPSWQVELEGADWSAHADLTARALGAALPDHPRRVRLLRRSQIPVARGLGSSGAAVAAGLALAQALPGAALDPDEQRALGCRLEGHPDNVMASLLGGLVLSAPHATGVHWQHAPVHPDLEFGVAWPAQPMPTAEARAVLPERVPLADAVENARRLPVLLRGLATGDGALIAFGLEDRWHVAARAAIQPGATAALEAARAAGAHGATLSGSGSALVALAPRGGGEAAARAMATALREARGAAEWVCPPVVTGAPTAQAFD
jgi:homoserine kinase